MKKGSLELGVNFTVVMIIALIILGLTLVFVLNVFNFAGEKFPESAPDIIFHATPADPILPETRTLNIRSGEDEAILVSVYNNLWAPEEDITLSISECRDSENNIEEMISLSAVTQQIDTQEDKGYLAIARSDEQVFQGSYVCTILAGIANQDNTVNPDYPHHSTQIQIEVTD